MVRNDWAGSVCEAFRQAWGDGAVVSRHEDEQDLVYWTCLVNYVGELTAVEYQENGQHLARPVYFEFADDREGFVPEIVFRVSDCLKEAMSLVPERPDPIMSMGIRLRLDLG